MLAWAPCALVFPLGFGRSLKCLLASAAVNQAVMRSASSVIDVSSGSYGIELARAAARCRLNAEVFVPLAMSGASTRGLSELGAQVTAVSGGISEAREAAARRAGTRTGSFFADQHANLALHRTAYSSIVGDLIRLVPNMQAVAVACGTGGLLRAVGDGLRTWRPGIHLVRVKADDPPWAACETSFSSPTRTESIRVDGCEAELLKQHFRRSMRVNLGRVTSVTTLGALRLAQEADISCIIVLATDGDES